MYPKRDRSIFLGCEMKIRMLQTQVGPKLKREKNKEYEVAKDEAARMIAKGIAVAVRSKKRETAQRKPAEKAVINEVDK